MRLAAQGLRNLDTGDEKVEDAAERKALQRQARKVYVQSVAMAVVLTAVAMVA